MAAPGFAQSPRARAEMVWPGTIVQRLSTRKAEETIRAFAQCIANERLPDVKAFLALPDNSPRIRELGTSLAMGSGSECSPYVFMTTHASQLRYALIEVLYNRDFRGSGSPSAVLGDDAGVIDVAKCIVKAAPSEADQLIATAPASKQQKAAFKELASYAQTCGVELPVNDAGQQLLRFQIAEALYRLRSASLVTTK
jgi:hypothetical protein